VAAAFERAGATVRIFDYIVSLYSPEKLKAQLDAFLAGIAQLDAITEERLADAADTITTAVTTTLQTVGAKLDDFANKIKEAADTQAAAAAAALQAANTPVKVAVTVTLDGDGDVNG